MANQVIDDVKPEIEQAIPSFKKEATCSLFCKKMLEQVENTFVPTPIKTNDMFVTLCNQEEAENKQACTYNHPINNEVHRMVQILACWALVRLRKTNNPHAIQQAISFMAKLEEASYHLQKALNHDSTLKQTILLHNKSV